MPSLILSSDTLSVRLHSRRLEIVRRDHKNPQAETVRTDVPLHDLDRVVVIGRPSLTTPVLTELMDSGIPCYFLTRTGRWRGTLSSDRNLNAARRIRQYEQATDPFFGLRVARRLIAAKIRNSRRVLQRLAANRELTDTPEHEVICKDLHVMIGHALNAETLDEVRGVEGMAAARYFRRIATFFPAATPFSGRSRRPPRDAANALLSWTYAILLGEVEGAVRSHGLDAAIGCLHQDTLNTPSLALDLLEPLRPAVADLLVLSILNHNILRPEHFEYSAEDGGTYLTEEARKPFFITYEQAMTRRFAPSKDAPHTTLRQVIDMQVCTYLRALERGVCEEDFFLLP
jgi:CRISPR-associated protein Cas1